LSAKLLQEGKEHYGIVIATRRCELFVYFAQ
jgi:hypothetical protein